MIFRRPKPLAICAGVDWGTGADEGIASPCGQRLKGKEIHRVYSGVQESREYGGASAMVGDYCAHHCPGDCSNPHCRLTRAVHE